MLPEQSQARYVSRSTMTASKTPPRSAVLRTVHTHALLLIGFAVMSVTTVLAATTMRISAAALIGWDVGVAVYLALVFYRIMGATSASIRRRADEIDETKWVVLIVTVGAGLVSLLALGAELIASKDAPDAWFRAPLAIVSVALSWVFVHTVFALFYAHEWHHGERALLFPEAKAAEPGYLDFFYFSFVIGMTFQVSDVQTRNSGMRRVVLVHGIISFLFSTVILALGVNLTASMF
jgi:uncharacterized membrane protein